MIRRTGRQSEKSYLNKRIKYFDMGIEMNTEGLDEYLEAQVERRIKALIFGLSAIGATVTNEAKTGKTYKDQTGALISSTGYVVIRDGVIINGSGFSGIGARVGEEAIKAQIAKYSTGVWLIVVAGMNYAAAVEARNYNVLTSAELLADQVIPQLMQQLGFTK